MKYKLTEEYFETPIFQNTVQKYFDTVLKGILNYKEIIQAKGLFVIDREVKNDLYDMPYHIHILNGLIPALFVYEKFLLERGWINEDTDFDEEAEKYLKTFMLGFTFHDADKLIGIGWNNALEELDKITAKFFVSDFFHEFETYKSDVFFIALSTEDRTEVLKNRYKVSLDFHHLTEILAQLCNFADGIASIQELDGVEMFYKEAIKSLAKINQIVDLKLSYIKIHENPYTLLSQNLLNTAAKVIKQSGRSILYTMRDGFLFFGDDLKETEKELIFSEFENSQADDIDIEKLVKVDAQQCDFSSIKSIGIDKSILIKVIEKKSDLFLKLSPNSIKSLPKLDMLIEFSKQAFQDYIEVVPKNDVINLFFSDSDDEDNKIFEKLFSLHRMQWLNTKINNNWKKDYEKWETESIDLTDEINYDDNVIKTTEQIVNLFSEITTKENGKLVRSSRTNLLKVYLCFFKTLEIIYNENDIDEYTERQYREIKEVFQLKEPKNNSVFEEFYKKYFTFKGNKDISSILDFIPNIPEKKKMCAFTGGLGTKDYKDVNSHGLKATGFNNRTWAALKNTNNPVNYVSPLFDEENKKRTSAFEFKKIAATDTVLSIYYDFFETTLDIDRDIFKTIAISRNLNIVDSLSIELYKNAKFDYSSNLQFVKENGDIKTAFYFIIKQLLLVQKLGVRIYITGIMSPYRSHKEAFVYENAPRFAKDLGWNKVRLHKINEVLDEISILMELGKSRKSINSGLVLNYAESPNSIFQAFYRFAMQKEKKEVDKARNKLIDFINNYPLKFKNMTTTEKLVDIALQIQSSAKSGSEETWLIRTALDFVRKNRKEKRSKADTIQQIGGNIHKTLRQERINSTVIEFFAKTIYEELYEKEWKGNLPTINRQKDWIYQFGFVYKMRVDELLNEKSDEKIINNLKKQKQDITRENILNMLSEKQKKYFADTIIERILNKVNNK